MVEKCAGKWTHASVRPEAVELVDAGLEADGLHATVHSTAFLGTATRVSLDLDGFSMVALLPKGARIPESGEQVHVKWSPEDLHLMDEA